MNNEFEKFVKIIGTLFVTACLLAVPILTTLSFIYSWAMILRILLATTLLVEFVGFWTVVMDKANIFI